MLRLASDADVHGDIIRGLRRRAPTIDLIRTSSALAEGTHDTEVLAWAAADNRILISNDRNTMVNHAHQRLFLDQSMPGIIVTTNDQSIGQAIEDILIVAECMPAEEIRERVVVYLPLHV